MGRTKGTTLLSATSRPIPESDTNSAIFNVLICIKIIYNANLSLWMEIINAHVAPCCLKMKPVESDAQTDERTRWSLYSISTIFSGSTDIKCEIWLLRVVKHGLFNNSLYSD